MCYLLHIKNNYLYNPSSKLNICFELIYISSVFMFIRYYI